MCFLCPGEGGGGLGLAFVLFFYLALLSGMRWGSWFFFYVPFEETWFLDWMEYR